MKHYRYPGRQRGMVMIIALVMLIAVTLMTVSASNVVQTNLKAVQNMESREQVRTAAMSAIEELLAADQFRMTPDNVFAQSCEVNNRKCYDINGDGVTDIKVDVEPPVCVLVRQKKNRELSLPGEMSCFTGSAQGRKDSDSNCADSVWEITATARDEVTGAEVTVRQGTAVVIRRLIQENVAGMAVAEHNSECRDDVAEGESV